MTNATLTTTPELQAANLTVEQAENLVSWIRAYAYGWTLQAGQRGGWLEAPIKIHEVARAAGDCCVAVDFDPRAVKLGEWLAAAFAADLDTVPAR